MRAISFVSLLSLFLITSSVLASNSGFETFVISQTPSKIANDLSKITSRYVYNLDKKQLTDTLRIVFENYGRIRGVVIEDYGTKSVFVSCFKDSGDGFNEGKIPQRFEQYQKQSSNLVHQGILLGTITVYVEKARKTEDSMDLFTRNLSVVLIMLAVFFTALAYMFKQLVKSNKRANWHVAFGSSRFAKVFILCLSSFIFRHIESCWWATSAELQQRIYRKKHI